MARAQPETFDCPNCGADVRVGALACQECGSDKDTGWSDETLYDGLDLPEPDDDDDFGAEADPPSYKTAFYGLTAVALLIAFFWAFFGGGRLW